MIKGSLNRARAEKFFKILEESLDKDWDTVYFIDEPNGLDIKITFKKTTSDFSDPKVQIERRWSVVLK